MVDVDRLEMLVEPLQFGQSGIADGPVGQQLGKCRDEVEAAAATARIAVEEGRNHHHSTILVDLCAIVCRRLLLEARQGIAEAVESR